MAISIIQSSHPGRLWWISRTQSLARSMAVVIGPSIQASIAIVFGLVSGLVKFGLGHVIMTLIGGWIPPGIVATSVRDCYV